jgi:PAS domain S-box-containing protein
VSPPADGARPATDSRAPGRVVGLVVVVGLVAAAVGASAAGMRPPAEPRWLALPVLALLLVAATWSYVPFRTRDSVDAVNLVEAALAPLLLAFPAPAVVAVVAASQVANGLLRRLAPIKTAFNTASWTLAAGLGAAVVAAAGDGPLLPDRVVALVVALAVVGLVNTALFAVVVALAEREPLGQLARRLRPVAQLGWLGGWAINVALGLLLALAYTASPLAALLFVVPVLVLHLAYRGYTAARADQHRLAAAHRAANLLSAPLNPRKAIGDFLAEVVDAFDAAQALLVLRTDGGREVHRFDRGTGALELQAEAVDTPSLAGVLLATPRVLRVAAGSDEVVTAALTAEGRSSCLAAPLLEGSRIVGAIAILDRAGFEGSRAGEMAIVEALAREAASALAKGRLLDDVFEERRRLAEIVGSTSDGICTLAADGRVLTWNPALERMTGLSADQVLGRRDVARRLRLRTVSGRPVNLVRRPLGVLPTDLRLTSADGGQRHLSCSYSAGSDAGAALVVVARDVTPVDEQEALREQLEQLVEADAARRAVVEQLQQAVLPAPLPIPGAELAAAYEASDPSEPTGGDLFDWQLLPSGEVHVAVVDVLGHGVAATKDALAVVHTLRVATADGTPLEELVARADELLGAQHPELVATVIVARYHPATGRLRVASGGHPPALVISPERGTEPLHATGGVIGWPGAGSDEIAETVLRPGEALLLYTDGLVEARKDILDGMEELARHAREVVQLPADALAAELVERALAGADRRDDTLALVLRRDPAAVGLPLHAPTAASGA